MLMENATEVRKEWSRVVDDVIRDKPKIIKRTRDKMWFSSLDIMNDILSAYQFTAKKFVEKDNSITLSLNEIEIIENDVDEQKARLKMAKAILDYSMDYYNDYAYWSSAPNRKQQIPYVFKSLIMDDVNKLGDSIICQDGEN